MERVDVAAWLVRWKGAGLLNEAQVSSILAFEAVDGSAPRGGRVRVGLQEVVAYAGVAVTLAGVALAVGLHYDQLGIGGRLAIYGVVSAIAFVAARQLSGHPGAGERASAACLTVGILGCGAIVGDATATMGLATRHQSVAVGPDVTSGAPEEDDYGGNVALGYAMVTGLALVAFSRRASTIVALTLVGSAFATTYLSWHALGGSSPTEAGLIGLLPGALLIALAQRRALIEAPACEVVRALAALIPIAALYAVSNDTAAGFAALGGLLSVSALGGALTLRSPGLAVAGGLGLFGLVVDVVGRYFADALGAPIAFVVSGLTLIAAALLIQQVIRVNTVRGRILNV